MTYGLWPKAMYLTCTWAVMVCKGRSTPTEELNMTFPSLSLTRMSKLNSQCVIAAIKPQSLPPMIVMLFLTPIDMSKRPFKALAMPLGSEHGKLVDQCRGKK